MKVLDLRFKEPGCTGHPVIRLSNKLREINESEIIIRFNVDDIPLKAFELLISKYGYKINDVKDFNAYVEVRIVKSQNP